MALTWQRRSRLITPPAEHCWWRSHAQAPTPLVLGRRRWRIFFAARDERNRSRIIFVDVDPQDEMRLLGPYSDPVLPLGPRGCFDADGQGPASVLRIKDRIYMFYSGIRVRSDVPHGIASGVAVSLDGGVSFERASDEPILSVGADHAFHASLPFVEPEGDGFAAWYMRGVRWIAQANGGTPRASYDLRRAVSAEGLAWTELDDPAVRLEEGEAGLARPWVWTHSGGRQLIFSSRIDASDKVTYRLTSVRLDDAGNVAGARAAVALLPTSDAGDWDAKMQAYASVVPLGEGGVMFYSGNDYGRSGIGWATLDVAR